MHAYTQTSEVFSFKDQIYRRQQLTYCVVCFYRYFTSQCSAVEQPSRMASRTPTYPGVPILLLLLTVLPSCAAQNTYYVKPTPDTPCLGGPCYTLSEYVSQSERYFTSNTTMILLPGEHALQDNITVRNSGRLVFIRNPSSSPTEVSRIICTDATFTFENILMLEITDIGFHSCTIQLHTSSVLFKNNSFENSTSEYGGAIYTYNSIITFDGETRFENNRAAGGGGGIYAEESNLIFYGNTAFINNEALERGGGIFVRESTVSFGGSSSFNSNSARYGGGVDVLESTVSFGDNSSFNSNSARLGGGVAVWESTVSFDDDGSFISNSAEGSGGGVYVRESNVSFGDNSSFISNSAELNGGGGVIVWESTMSFGDDSCFISNSAAKDDGGGVYVWLSTVSFGDNTTFISNSAERGGGLYIILGSYVSFGNDSDVTENSASYFGGCVAAWDSTIDVGSRSDFLNNSAWYGGCIFMERCNLTLSKTSTFSGNSAITRNGGSGDAYIWGYGGAIVGSTSNLIFGETQELTNNSAGYGGAIYLTHDSKIYLRQNTSMYFKNNCAQYRGGALFVEDNPFTYCILDSEAQAGVRHPCFIQMHEYQGYCAAIETGLLFPIFPHHLGHSIDLQFQENAAKETGSILYGGNLDSCAICFKTTYLVGGAFDKWAKISNNSLISSDPYRVCLCLDNQPDCSQSKISREIYPGSTFLLNSCGGFGSTEWNSSSCDPDIHIRRNYT